MPFVLDASVTVAWYLPDEHGDYARGVRNRLRADAAFVPGLWATEVANACLVAVRRSRIALEELGHIRASLGRLPITLDETGLATALGSVLNLAYAHQLTAYDAAYLELALRMSLAIATLDQGLREAARKLGVRTLE